MIDHCELHGPHSLNHVVVLSFLFDKFDSVKIRTIIWPFTELNIILKTQSKQKHSSGDRSLTFIQAYIKKTQTVYEDFVSSYLTFIDIINFFICTIHRYPRKFFLLVNSIFYKKNTIR